MLSRVCASSAISEAEAKAGVLSVKALRIPKEYRGNDQLGEYEGALIAGTIRHALDSGLTIPRTDKEVAAGIPKQVQPGDFLIVTPMTGKLGAYSRKLQELGIPHLVTGGDPMNQVPEILLLHTCLVAVTQPDNRVALVAAFEKRTLRNQRSDPVQFQTMRRVFFLSWHSSEEPRLVSDPDL